MVGIYFSGTGNSKYAIERFCKEYDEKIVTYSIEDNDALSAIINAATPTTISAARKSA